MTANRMIETVELNQFNLKKKHEYKMTNEIESLRMEGSQIIIEGFCFLRKISPKRIKNIRLLFEDQSPRNRKAIVVKELEKKTRKDVTFIFAGKHDNYDYSGFKAVIDIRNLPDYKKYKQFKLMVMFEVDGRNIILPFTKNHSTLGKNKMPQYESVQMSYKKHFFLNFNRDKSFSQKYESLKDQLYVKVKGRYKDMPLNAKKGYVRSTLVFMKNKILR
ncbi:hypothetical protein GLW03_13185 [Halobacillus halophilus]|uniref:hypothetical protein n=1 Tax=Halobacillus halophilus TaxID=1570 RepID=UPI001370C83C|nr:hypothetical protein [Halobacillus halophilus]MYL30764.1 hypothetical protein [Halobacillus halophilus]